MTSSANSNREYYFVDIDLTSRHIIGWGTETKDEVEVKLSPGFHRIFLSKGQYNKLQKQLNAAATSNG